MNANLQYSLISEADISSGLNNGKFTKSDISLIRDREGRIVKHLKKSNCDMILPSTLVQINNQIIYQSDLRPVIDALIETKNNAIHDDLEEKYRVLIVCLEYYINYQGRLDELNSKALDYSTIFETRINKYIANFSIKDVTNDELERFDHMLDAYINIMFIYMLSAYWLHADKSANDSTIIKKFDSLINKSRDLYEQTLCNSKLCKKKKDNGKEVEFTEFSMDNSLYAKYFLLKDGGLVSFIEKFMVHDSRFDSYTNFTSFISRCFFKSNMQRDGYQIWNEHEYKINIKAEPIDDTDNKKHALVISLFNVIEKVETLKSISAEIECLGELSTSEIDVEKSTLSDHAIYLLSVKNTKLLKAE